ncbi:ATG8-interacting protein 1 [Brachypodium distachyon]|uniref:ATG8-interacting protein 1 n=1 Tax=Brachypodium distachyon TaxID=15368 RepID=I1H256_BRADI|nr:ATG8-interacting protein 1 [Brachypodium distachyon]XP_014752847.1 ATG8-interacting protein 1 [Brachypodium distachyon]KQK20104.1 hypothetical protein BRADI_1g52500v3 [Brachypodium distachyon]KQK20105.1 hypothetical protein BRADI_1g52500v3 [Brachypodium distachyon]|eukprot:XP_003557293.1 ATG8-interacting protein 1 [Brachypodium distachyon]
MANASKVAEGSSLADEWDMTSLTSSVYTSPLFQTGFDSVHVPKYGNVSSQKGPYPGLFISDDFVFPPSEHENLPIEFEVDGLNIDTEGLDGCRARNSVEGCNEPHQEVDDNSDENPFLSSDFSCVNEATSSDLKLYEIHGDQVKNSSCGKSDLPCEGWWQRKSTHVFHHIKGVTTVSIVAAGALVGFVIMGQRWQQDRWHLHQFQFSFSGESMNRVMGLFSRLKDGLPGSQQLRSLLPTRVFSQQPLSA